MITYLSNLRKTRAINVCFWVILFVLISGQVYAQQVTLTGQVADLKNAPISLATINFVGNSITTTTDDNGLFAIKLPLDFKKGDQLTIRVSKEGYKTSTRLITISPISIPIRLSRQSHYVKAATITTPTNLSANVKLGEQKIPSSSIGGAPNINKSFGDVSPSIVGDNSHIVGGFGNSVGVNGDLNITTERKLADDFLSLVYTSVDDLVKSKGFSKNNISVLAEPYSNAPVITSQIVLYFKERGYSIGSGIISSNGPMINGIRIDTSNRIFLQKDRGKGIKIILGYFK